MRDEPPDVGEAVVGLDDPGGMNEAVDLREGSPPFDGVELGLVAAAGQPVRAVSIMASGTNDNGPVGRNGRFA